MTKTFTRQDGKVFNFMYAAGRLNKTVGKGEKRDYVKYLIVKGGNAYITDTRVLITTSVDIPDGAYRFLKVTKSEVEIALSGEQVDSPDYATALDCTGKYPFELTFSEDIIMEDIALNVYDTTGAAIQAKYLEFLRPLGLSAPIAHQTDERDALILVEDGVQAVVAPFIRYVD